MRYFLIAKDGVFTDNTHNYHTDKIAGHLVKATFKESKNGVELLRIHLVDEVNHYILQLVFNSRISEAFCRTVPNIMLFDPVGLKITRRDGKDFLSIKQKAEQLPWFYKQLPAGADKLEFMRTIIYRELAPMLARKKNPYPNHPDYKPMYKHDLQGGYFDEQRTQKKVEEGSVTKVWSLPTLNR